jgi:dsRNA-specific ribonuclease
MGAYINGELIAKGKGSSKQKAEDDAANNALTKKGWE